LRSNYLHSVKNVRVDDILWETTAPTSCMPSWHFDRNVGLNPISLASRVYFSPLVDGQGNADIDDDSWDRPNYGLRRLAVREASKDTHAKCVSKENLIPTLLAKTG